jgi:hypothetical protein
MFRISLIEVRLMKRAERQEGTHCSGSRTDGAQKITLKQINVTLVGCLLTLVTYRLFFAQIHLFNKSQEAPLRHMRLCR